VQDRQTEATHIADMILDRREEGVNYGEQAVLVRSMRNIRHVELELAARGIPTVVRGGIRIHEAGHVKDVLCGLRIISNISDEPAWMRLLLLCKKVGEKTAAGIARTVIEQGSVAGAIKALEDAALKRPSLLLAIDVLRAISSTDMPGLALAAARGALEDILSHNYDEEWDYRRKDIEALIDIAAGYDSMEEFLRSITIDVSVDKRVEYDGEAPDD